MFDMGQKVILLRLVEMVDLVDEQHGRFAETLQLLCFLDDFFEIFDARGDGGKIDADCVCADLAMSCASVVLPLPGGPQRISERSFPGSACRQELARAEQCSWPTNSSRGFRAHTIGQRLCSRWLG